MSSWVCRAYDLMHVRLSLYINNTFRDREDLRLSGSIVQKSRLFFTKERTTIRQKSVCLDHSNERIFQVHVIILMQGRIKDSWKGGFICIKDVGFALWMLSHLSLIFYDNEIIWSHRDQIISFLVSSRPNYFIFIEYLIAGRVGRTP